MIKKLSKIYIEFLTKKFTKKCLIKILLKLLGYFYKYTHKNVKNVQWLDLYLLSVNLKTKKSKFIELFLAVYIFY